MTDKLRDLDLRAVFASLRISRDLPPEIFVRRSTRPLPGAIIEPARIAEPELPPPGAVLGAYQLERAIGIGRIGAVYCARHLALDRTVAIKLLRPSVVRARPTVPRLATEDTKRAAQIDHPNAVKVHDAATSDDQTYLIMEYVDGPDLSVMLRRRGALPCKVVVRILRHVVAALAAGFAQDQLHGDVKPSNILMTRAGITKLGDFGLARARAAEAAGARRARGTANYMAPEQAKDPQRIDVRSDIYSLGVTAYHALTGRLPAHTLDGAPGDRAPGQFAPVPSALDDLVVAATSPRPAERPDSYATVEQILRTLR